MNFVDFYAGKDDNDRRLDRVIRIFAPDLSMSEIYKGIRKKLIRVNDGKISENYRVQENDKISIAEFLINQKEDLSNTQNPSKSASSTDKITKDDLPEIVFENEHVIIFNKPVNMAVHGSSSGNSSTKSKMSLEELMQGYFNSSEKKSASLSFKPGPLHRIDRNTSGLIAFSWSIDGARWFTENIKNHRIHKFYYGIIQGTLKNTEKWSDYIGKSPDNQKKGFVTVSVNKNPQNDYDSLAETDVIPLAYGKIQTLPITYVKFQIYTGRQHQIRAQSKAHNHPLLGDTAYGGSNLDGKLKNFFLHAAELYVPENKLNIPALIKADLPKEFKDFLTKTCDMS